MNVWTWIKALMSDVGTFLMPLLKKLLTKTGKLLCDVATQAVKEVATNTTVSTWQEKLDLGVGIAIAQLKSQGKILGVDFFLNEVITAITAAIAKNYDESK